MAFQASGQRYLPPATVTSAGRRMRSAMQVALLQHRDHGVGFLWGIGGQRHHGDGLVLVRVELGARRGVDLDHLVALERALELAQGGFGAFADLLGGGVLVGQAGLQAVQDGQHALGEALDGELAGLGHLVLGAAAGILDIGLGAQVLLGQFRVLGLEGGQLGLRLARARRAPGQAGPPRVLPGPARKACRWGSTWVRFGRYRSSGCRRAWLFLVGNDSAQQLGAAIPFSSHGHDVQGTNCRPACRAPGPRWVRQPTLRPSGSAA